MLVLSRKKNESIRINDDIEVLVVEIRGDKVRIGIDAPKEVRVHRNEVYDAINKNEPSEPTTSVTIEVTEAQLVTLRDAADLLEQPLAEFIVRVAVAAATSIVEASTVSTTDQPQESGG